MNILEFTFEAPSKWYGGGICVAQSVISLSAKDKVTYVGPKYDENEYNQITLEKAYYLDDNNGFFTKVINLFRGVTTKYFQEWKRAVGQIDSSEYDVACMDFSYNDFIVKWAKNNGLKSIVRVHNIEADMVDSSIKGKVHDKYWLRNLINGWIIKIRERNVMNMCDHLVFLTLEDQRRACELYGEFIKEKSSIIPICMYANNKEYSDVDIQKPYILATGSLYYGPNAEGIKWLVKNVWEEIQNSDILPGYRLVIAGRNPDDEMKQLISSANNCVLVESPEDIFPYYQNAELYLAPIFYGAGMKVKVSEAMSYGVTVIGSHHALIGYEEASKYCIEANTKEEYIEEIKKYILAGAVEKEECIEHFDKTYSMERSINSYHSLVHKIATV